jgi:hypothetical protein
VALLRVGPARRQGSKRSIDHHTETAGRTIINQEEEGEGEQQSASRRPIVAIITSQVAGRRQQPTAADSRSHDVFVAY